MIKLHLSSPFSRTGRLPGGRLIPRFCWEFTFLSSESRILKGYEFPPGREPPLFGGCSRTCHGLSRPHVVSGEVLHEPSSFCLSATKTLLKKVCFAKVMDVADAMTKTEQPKLSIPLLANCSLLALLAGLKWKLHLQRPL